MIQGSGEWIKSREGKVTASRIVDVMARTKSGPSEKRNTYMRELLVERLTGTAIEHFVNDAMAWGLMQEDMARAAYEARHGLIVEQVGFIPHPTIANTGASPDGLVGLDGLIEIKCPTTGTHIETLIYGDIDIKYQYQMAWQIECTGCKWCDFISYDPRLPAELSYFRKRFTPSAEFMDGIREEVKKFLSELDELEAKVRAYRENE